MEKPMSDETMIGRVATALIGAICQQGPTELSRGDLDAALLARAAIKAMREPSEKMLDAGWQPFEGAPLAEVHASPEETYAAMIDAALKE
jgi:hypothetical protein